MTIENALEFLFASGMPDRTLAQATVLLMEQPKKASFPDSGQVANFRAIFRLCKSANHQTVANIFVAASAFNPTTAGSCLTSAVDELASGDCTRQYQAGVTLGAFMAANWLNRGRWFAKDLCSALPEQMLRLLTFNGILQPSFDASPDAKYRGRLSEELKQFVKQRRPEYTRAVVRLMKLVTEIPSGSAALNDLGEHVITELAADQFLGLPPALRALAIGRLADRLDSDGYWL